MNDSDFDNLLRSARDRVPVAANFRQGVWHRIESASLPGTTIADGLASFFATLARPWIAGAGMTAALVLGLWLGATTGPAPSDDRLAYVESVSPFAHISSK